MNDYKARISAVEISLQYRCDPCPKDIRSFGAHVFLTTHIPLLLCPRLLLAFFNMEEIYGHFKKS